MSTKFTNESLNALKPRSSRYVVCDPKTTGLHLRVGTSGVKTWWINKRINGVDVQERMSEFQAEKGGPIITSVEMAREEFAARCVALGAAGQVAKRKATSCKLTFDAAFEAYRAKNPDSVKFATLNNQHSTYDNHIKPHIGSKLLTAVEQADVKDMRKLMVDAHYSGRAINLMLTVIRRTYAWAIDEKHLPLGYVLPTTDVKGGKKSKGRKRIITKNEFAPFWATLDGLAHVKHPTRTSRYFETVADAIRMELFTGARGHNVRTMRWKDISLTRALWTVPKSWRCEYCSSIPHVRKGVQVLEETYHGTKTDEVYEIPLTSQALEIINRRHAGPAGLGEFVFPGRGDAPHLGSLKKVWATVIERAGLDGLTMHDLRRTQGSKQAQLGVNPILIGHSLCHANPGSDITAIYTHADGLDEIRENMERANRAMLNVDTGEAVELTLAEWEEIAGTLEAVASPLASKIRTVVDAMRTA